MHHLSSIAQRFPLVARPRPACPSLEERVREIHDLARAALDETDTDGLSLAAQAHNKAALIASDCGLPELARSLCWQHFRLYTPARPLNAHTARYALEPIINLARLQIRAGDNDGGYRLLHSLFQAVRSRTTTTIDGTVLNIEDLIAPEEAHQAICQWLWTVLLADGTRALTSAGHWAQALHHLKQHHGVGDRMLDGRQAAILAHHLTGDTTHAQTLLNTSKPTEAWEHAVAACLNVLCAQPTAKPSTDAITTMIDRYLEIEPTPGLTVFRCRLGLITIDLTQGTKPSAVDRITAHLIDDVLTTNDGYATQQTLRHQAIAATLTSTKSRKLSAILHQTGLDGRTVPDDLLHAVAMSDAATSRHLGVTRNAKLPDRFPHACTR